ncbi:MAG: hypothetical protein IPL15_23825 [Comamonadaceae bacterium]|uniref:hypothetical protein n=1 Tax=Candidatus Skiveiella danica TaxID=3386177 RepID=UPI00390B7FE7|nr:hypothetical protein [Comamonadaceae bacterium]
MGAFTLPWARAIRKTAEPEVASRRQTSPFAGDEEPFDISFDKVKAEVVGKRLMFCNSGVLISFPMIFLDRPL